MQPTNPTDWYGGVQSCFVRVSVIVTFCFVIATGCYQEQKKETVASVAAKVSLPKNEAYQEVDPAIDFGLKSLRMNIAETDTLAKQLDSKLAELGQCFAKQVLQNDAIRPSFVSPDFRAEGIDRDAMESRFNASGIKVDRWVVSGSAPKFEGANAFEEFSANALAAWQRANSFRIDFKINRITESESTISVSVVVEIYGQTNRESGVQATSLWKTEWEKADQVSELSLTSVRIVGREELSVQVVDGRILHDVSQEVFQTAEPWGTQLQLGIGDLAKRIPGIDLLGNHGVALQDINGDGLCDIYVCEPHGLPNLMFRQNQDGTVREVAGKSGVNVLDECRCALIVDLDNDGDQDLAVTSDQNLLLFSNDGDCNFQLEHELRIGAGGTSLAAADYDLDGDLDLFMCREFSMGCQSDIVLAGHCRLDKELAGENILLRNDEAWQFSDVTDEVGLRIVSPARSKSATWIDFDSDGDQDLFVANEWTSSRLFENRDGWFVDVSAQLAGLETARHRSVSVADFNRDTKPDFFIASDSTVLGERILDQQKAKDPAATEVGRSVVSPSAVVRSKVNSAEETGGTFEKYPLPSPVFSTESAFGSTVLDINNDGLEDVLVGNGFLSGEGENVDSFWYEKLSTFPLDSKSLKVHAVNVSDVLRSGMSLGGKQRNCSYLNLGQIGFANLAGSSGIGFSGDTRAIATADWDDDGNVDVVTLSREAPRLRLFLNRLETGNRSTSILLRGTSCNADAIGAKVEVWISNSATPIVKWVQAQSGYLAQSSRVLVFGLAEGSEITKINVTWPGGASETFRGVEPGRSYRIVQGTSSQQVQSVQGRSEILQNVAEMKRSPAEFPLNSPSVFYPPAVLPECSVKSVDDSWCRLKNEANQPMLTLFYDDSERSKSMLRQISSGLDSFNEVKLAAVAIFCADQESFDAAVRQADSMTAKINWPFPSVAMPSQELSKLGVAFRDWFSISTTPDRPFALVTNSDGLVEAYFPAETLSVAAVLESIGRAGQDSDDRQSQNRTDGFWAHANRYPSADRLAYRFRNLGLIDVANQLEEQTKKNKADRLAMQALSFAASANSVKANELIDKAIAIDSRCLLAYLQRGHVGRMTASRMPLDSELHGETLGRAARAFALAMKLDASCEEAVIGYADVHVDMMLVDVAMKALQDFLMENPDSAKVQAILGRLQFSTDQRTEATRNLKSAFDRHPTLPFVAGDLGFIFLSDGDASTANSYLEIAYRQQPSDLNILRLYAEAQFATANFDKTAELLDRYVTLKPSQLRSTCMLAWILATSPEEKTRNGKRAIELIEPLQKLQGDESAYLNEIAAACYAEIGDFEKATELQILAANMVAKVDRNVDFYDEAKKRGLEERLRLFKDGLPYRTSPSGLDEVPILNIEKRLKDSKSLRQ